MGCLSGFLVLAWYAVKWAGIAFFYFMKYTLPIQIAVLGFTLGVSAGGSCSGMRNEWVEEQKRANCHTVTIVWNYENAEYNENVTVRKDMQWNVDGCITDGFLWSDSMTERKPCITDGANYGKAGFECIGFFSDAMGIEGIQYASAGGVGLMQINEDTTIYAVWQKV